MAITTLDGALAGMKPPSYYSKVATPTLVAGRPHSTWYLAGAPAAGAAPANTSGGTSLSSTSSQVTGQVYRTDPGSGNAYLARFTAAAGQAGMLLLCDRLYQCAGTTGGAALVLTSSNTNTVNTNALPTRDQNGLSNGTGVQVGVEVVTSTGAGTPTLTMSYTDESNNAGSTANNIDTVVATSAIGAFYRMGLAAGDLGVRSVQSLTVSATMTSGAVALVFYRVLAALELPGVNIPNAIDALTSGFPQLFNGTVPFFIFIPNTTTASQISGTYAETQG